MLRSRHLPPLLLPLALAACAKPELPRPDADPWTPLARTGCGEYVFDSALAVLADSTDLMRNATAIHAYAAPDTNTLGWTQHRFVLELRTPVSPRQPVSVVYFHGGGGDVGHAGNADEDLKELLRAGYDVWSVEYRRGWHAGSYDPCLPRDPFAATAADLARFDTAAAWALADARAALAFVAGRTSDSLLLWGSSFGAHLAMALGPYAAPAESAAHRVLGTAAFFGSMPADAPPLSPMPCFLLHGELDPVNGPDTGPLYGIGALAKGGRAVYGEIAPLAPSWLLMHPGGHTMGRLSGAQQVDAVERTLLGRRAAPGHYFLDETGIRRVPG
jgi:predicted esterase